MTHPYEVMFILRPDLGEDPRFATQADRVQHNDELMAELYAWAATETKHDLYRRAGAGRRRRGPALCQVPDRR
mgnify:CR=1 FL=1